LPASCFEDDGPAPSGDDIDAPHGLPEQRNEIDISPEARILDNVIAGLYRVGLVSLIECGHLTGPKISG